MTTYAIFGLSYQCKWFINEVGEKYISCIIDNKSSLWGTKWRGIPIISLDDYVNRKEEIGVIISSARYYNEIFKQLNDNNVNNIVSITNAWASIKLKKKKYKRIFLMNIHSYTNGGDYFITLSEKEYLENNFPQYEVEIIPSMVCSNSVNELNEYINSNDLILISGGGYLGNLWMENGEDNVRDIIEAFSDNPIIIFPQSMYFTKDAEGEEQRKITSTIYNKHRKLTVCLREEKSYEEAKTILSQDAILFVPDITFQHEVFSTSSRAGIGICMRDDKESCIAAEDREKLFEILKRRTKDISSIRMEVSELLSEEEAETEVKRKISKISGFKLVVTDRLHCMMMCYVTGTPCIVFDNLSGKISGTYEQIKNKSTIKMITRVAEIDSIIDASLLENADGCISDDGMKNEFIGLTNLMIKYLGS